MSSGSIRWRNKIVTILFIVGLSIAMLVLYRGYMEGNLAIDNNLITDIGAINMRENGEKLVAVGFDAFYAPDAHSEAPVYLAYVPTENDITHLDVVYIFVKESDNKEPRLLDASYRRDGLIAAVWGLGSWGACTSRVSIETPSCLIHMEDYNADGTSEEFETMLQLIIDTLKPAQ